MSNVQVLPQSIPPPPKPTLNLKAPAVILAGDAGTGKSTSIVTLLECGIEVFIIVTDPNGIDSVLDAVRTQPGTNILRKNAKELLSRLHFHNISAAPPGWSALKEMGTHIKAQNYQALADMKVGIDKQHMKSFESYLETCQNFTCDHCKRSFGDVTEFDDTRALVMDGLSGLNRIAREHTVGFKPTLHQGEWGIAMNLEGQMIYKLVCDCKCYFVLIAHLDKTVNEITGIPMISVAALGNKLAPQIIKDFSDIVITSRVKADFFWSTSESNTAVKNRALPIGDKLNPNFKQIVDVHNLRKQSMGEI